MTGDPLKVLRDALDEICPHAYAVDCDLLEHAKARAGHAALADVKALVETLRWYADTSNWRTLETMGTHSANLDRGMKARDALARFPATSPAKEQA